MDDDIHTEIIKALLTNIDTRIKDLIPEIIKEEETGPSTVRGKRKEGIKVHKKKKIITCR